MSTISMHRALLCFDEPHAPHVGGEVVHDGRAADRRLAGLELLQVEAEVLDLGEALIPALERLDVDGAQPRVPLPTQIRNRVPPDEAAGPAHHDPIAFVDLHCSSLISAIPRDLGRPLRTILGASHG